MRDPVTLSPRERIPSPMHDPHERAARLHASHFEHASAVAALQRHLRRRAVAAYSLLIGVLLLGVSLAVRFHEARDVEACERDGGRLLRNLGTEVTECLTPER